MFECKLKFSKNKQEAMHLEEEEKIRIQSKYWTTAQTSGKQTSEHCSSQEGLSSGSEPQLQANTRL